VLEEGGDDVGGAPQVRIALAFHHARSCTSGRADCLDGRVLRTAI
jgi:hypothetical protein